MRHRLSRTILLAVLAAVLAPVAASASTRMYVGFQDDPSFRFRDARQQNLQAAAQTGATLIRTTVDWGQVAPTRPAHPANPFDPAYRLSDVDELVRNAQSLGLEVMITIYGTPSWANGGKGENYVPTHLADLTNFARAIASRYSGRYPGYPFVRFFTVWNEPNLQQFLAPQFDSKGRDVAPKLYAKLYAAAYRGLKSGSPTALVGIGETSARGRDRLLVGGKTQQTHSPGRFAQLVAQANPKLKFDGWAQHPYPTTPSMKPTQKVRWPNVTLSSLPRFERSLDTWFHRKDIPIWITEYGHETRPEYPKGVSYATQAKYLRQAMLIARKDPRVQTFVWFVFRDDSSDPWKSGLEQASGQPKPALAAFSAVAKLVDAANQIVDVGASPYLRVPALQLAARDGTNATVGINYHVYLNGQLVALGQPTSAIGFDGWVPLEPVFTPLPGRSYQLQVQLNDANGNVVERTATLIRKAATTASSSG